MRGRGLGFALSLSILHQAFGSHFLFVSSGFFWVVGSEGIGVLGVVERIKSFNLITLRTNTLYDKHIDIKTQ